MIRLVIFDCDGTLVDSQHNIVAAMGSAFTRNNLTVPDACTLRRTVGLSPSVAMAELHPRGSFGERASLVEDYSQAFRALRLQPTMKSRCSKAPPRPSSPSMKPAICWASPPASRNGVCVSPWRVST